MAIYHCSVKIHSRGKGQSPIAAIAYRAGEKLEDELTGRVSDYSHRKGVVCSEIMLPEHVEKTHPEYKDRETLWNAVGEVECKANSQFSREFELALPKELSIEEMEGVIRDFAAGLVKEGMIIDWSLHAPHEILNPETGKMDLNHNWHCHMSATTRQIDETGNWMKKEKKVYAYDDDGQKIPEIDPETGKQKVRIREGHGTEKLWKRETIARSAWNKKENVQKWRKEWEESVNRGLEKAGREERVSCLSLQEQGIERIPKLHVGPLAGEIEKKQDRDWMVPFRYKEWTESGIADAFVRLRKFLEGILPVCRKADGMLSEAGKSIRKLADSCVAIARRIAEKGATRKDINEMIKARNRAADLLDAEIKRLTEEIEELKAQEVRDEAREQDIYERLERLRSQRADYATARRDAERDRSKGRGDSGVQETGGESEGKGICVSEEDKRHHRVRR